MLMDGRQKGESSRAKTAAMSALDAQRANLTKAELRAERLRLIVHPGWRLENYGATDWCAVAGAYLGSGHGPTTPARSPSRPRLTWRMRPISRLRLGLLGVCRFSWAEGGTELSCARLHADCRSSRRSRRCIAPRCVRDDCSIEAPARRARTAARRRESGALFGNPMQSWQPHAIMRTAARRRESGALFGHPMQSWTPHAMY
jgi:hypothetical protein